MRSSALLLALGVLLAAALGFAAHVVAQDTVGLPAVELEGGRPLAPEEAREQEVAPTTAAETEPAETGTDDGDSGPGSDSSGPGSGDDDSGRGRGRGRGRGGDD